MWNCLPISFSSIALALAADDLPHPFGLSQRVENGLATLTRRVVQHVDAQLAVALLVALDPTVDLVRAADLNKSAYILGFQTL